MDTTNDRPSGESQILSANRDMRDVDAGRANGRPNADSGEAVQHKEGPIALSIEQQTAKLPSDVFLWAAFGSIAASAVMHLRGKRETSNFLGHWAPTFLALGLYNKIVKVAGSDRAHSSRKAQGADPLLH